MAPVKNGRLLFNEIPNGIPLPGKATVYDNSQTIDLENVPLNGGFLVKTLVLSIDAFIRSKMRAPIPGVNFPVFKIGEPILDYGVGVVLRSENPAFKPGDHVFGTHSGSYPFVEYFVANNANEYRVLEYNEKLPWSLYVGPLGMPGQTAYYGWREHSQAKKGETVFVSSGASAVGSLVIQLAKLDGCKVIGSAGSDEKVAFMKKIGADVAFNYKKENTLDILRKEGGIDIYWDNVGGPTLEAALEAAKFGGRFIECGMISTYNNIADSYGVKTLFNVVPKHLKISGFVVSFLAPKYGKEFFDVLPAKVASGEIQYAEDVTQGLQYAGEALHAVFTGANKAKSIVVVAKE